MNGKLNIEKIEKMADRKGRSFRILIVDDEPKILDVFREFCELTNSVEVDVAENGTDALNKIKNTEYDLVTMDLIMPEMAGVEAVAKIKDTRPYLPIIVITGNATDKLIHQAGIKGASSILYKPVMLDDFVDEVTTTLERGNK